MVSCFQYVARAPWYMGKTQERHVCEYMFLHKKWSSLHGLSSLSFCRWGPVTPCIPSPNVGLTPLGIYNRNARGSDACRGNNSLWTRTLDRYARAGLLKCVVSTMSGPPRETTQDRIQTKELHSLYSSPNIIRNLQSRRLRWSGHLARMEQSINVYRISVGKP